MASISEAHHKRLSLLQEQLMKLEAQAADKNNSVYKYDYKETAGRVRKDIEIENKNFETTINALNKKC